MDNKITIKNQFLESYKNIVDEIIKREQRKLNKTMYLEKDINNKYKCIVCGGSFASHSKCKHNRTKKHKKKLNELYMYIIQNELLNE